MTRSRSEISEKIRGGYSAFVGVVVAWPPAPSSRRTPYHKHKQNYRHDCSEHIPAIYYLDSSLFLFIHNIYRRPSPPLTTVKFSPSSTPSSDELPPEGRAVKDTLIKQHLDEADRSILPAAPRESERRHKPHGYDLFDVSKKSYEILSFGPVPCCCSWSYLYGTMQSESSSSLVMKLPSPRVPMSRFLFTKRYMTTFWCTMSRRGTCVSPLLLF